MSKTPIPQQSTQWKQGIPTPIQNTMSLNTQAFHLITGFTTGQIQMHEDKVQYISQSQNESSRDSLNE